MTLVTAMFFTIALSAGNFESKQLVEVVGCTGSVGVDCDGDGIIDYYGTTSCEFLQALLQQFMESC